MSNLVVLLAALSLSQVTLWTLRQPPGPGLLVLIAGVFVAYSLDRCIDAPPAERRVVARGAMPMAMVAGAVISLGLVFAPRHLPLTALLGLIAVAYAPIKRWVPKGIPNALVWGVAVVWLPPLRPITFFQGAPLAACIALAVLANAVLCDTLDVADDRARRVKSIAARFGPKSAARASLIAAAASAAGSVAIGAVPLLAATIPLAAAAVFMTPRRRELQRLALDAIMIAPGLVALLITRG